MTTLVTGLRGQLEVATLNHVLRVRLHLVTCITVFVLTGCVGTVAAQPFDTVKASY